MGAEVMRDFLRDNWKPLALMLAAAATFIVLKRFV
jgi:hypothetical protein